MSSVSDHSMWFDCVDNNVCTSPGSESPCGISDNFEHNPTCEWLSSECDANGCDFTAYSEPNWNDLLQTYAYLLPQTGFPNCQLRFVSGSWVATNCPPGVDESDIVLPPSVDDAVVAVNTAYASQGLSTDKYELYAMCRLFHCSAGKDGDLPPFVDDMAVNSYLARHCCPMGTYWDPSIQECQDFTECYDPDPAEKPCQYDFNNDFEQWLEDVKGATNAIWAPQDCIFDHEISIGTTDSVLCCPIWEGGKKMHLWKNIAYYIQE